MMETAKVLWRAIGTVIKECGPKVELQWHFCQPWRSTLPTRYRWSIKMTKYFLFLSAVFLSFPATALECWFTVGLKGAGGNSTKAYAFSEDALGQFEICFSEDGKTGTVTGNDVPLTQMSPSTLAGFSANGIGLETFVTYQIDRESNHILHTKSRIGTSTASAILPDVVHAFAGKARKVSK